MPREAISYHYERNPADPRIQHALTLEVDDFGNVLKQAAIGYGRRTQIRVVDARGRCSRFPTPALPGSLPAIKRSKPRRCSPTPKTASPTRSSRADTHRNPLPCEALTFELTGYAPTGPAGRFQASDFVEPDPHAAGRLRHKFTDPKSPTRPRPPATAPPPDRMAAHALPARRPERPVAAR